MATDAKRNEVEEKPTAVTHFEDKTELGPDKPDVAQNADYTGAEAKTDPAEIALVRKIDWRLMVCIPAICFISRRRRNERYANR
jgi:hypothetical protein